MQRFRQPIELNAYMALRSFYDTDGNQYPVDSGSIGAIKVEDLDPAVLAEAIERKLGAIHEFPYELEALDAELERGVLSFGNVSIDTAGFDIEEDELDEWLESNGMNGEDEDEEDA